MVRRVKFAGGVPRGSGVGFVRFFSGIQLLLPESHSELATVRSGVDQVLALAEAGQGSLAGKMVIGCPDAVDYASGLLEPSTGSAVRHIAELVCDLGGTPTVMGGLEHARQLEGVAAFVMRLVAAGHDPVTAVPVVDRTQD
ncbi:hypothetical protein ACH4S8_06235 [Streptomyces sp. NPDC021080]|uniref:hypothetical protein n=1 Tax=Streptomyces sp. NPDC021080 TaxID=3365110 RepID=UPI0037AD7E44